MSLPPALYAEGIRIGDVGLVNQNGYFTSLFNIFRDQNDPVNTWNGVPPDFHPLELRQNLLDCRNDYHRARVPICSKHAKQVMLNVDGTVLAPGMPIVPGIGVELQFSRSQGAALMLPEGASRADYLGLPDVRDYATRNAQSWYQYLTDQVRIDADNGSLYLVTGYDKTHCYENVSFSNSARDCSVSLRFSSPILVNGNFGRLALSCSTSNTHAPSSRASNPENTLNNLSVFIRGFKIMIRRGPSSRFKRSAGKVMDVTKVDPKSVMYRGPSTSGLGTASSSTNLASASSSSSNSSKSNRDEASQLSLSPALSSRQSDVTSSDSHWLESDSESEFSSFSPRGSSIFASDSEGSFSEPAQYHPSDVLNDFMLRECPDALVAIAHDDEWSSVLKDTDDTFPQDYTLTSRIKENFSLRHEHGHIRLVRAEAEKLSLDALDSEEIEMKHESIDPNIRTEPDGTSDKFKDAPSPSKPDWKDSPFDSSSRANSRTAVLNGTSNDQSLHNSIVDQSSEPSRLHARGNRLHPYARTFYPVHSASTRSLSETTSTSMHRTVLYPSGKPPTDWTGSTSHTSVFPSEVSEGNIQYAPSIQADEFDNASSSSGSVTPYTSPHFPLESSGCSHVHDATRSSSLTSFSSPSSNSAEEIRQLRAQIVDFEQRHRRDKEQIQQLQTRLASSVYPPPSETFQASWRARTDARIRQFCSLNRAGNALCAWHDSRRERRIYPPRMAPAGYLNCGCSYEEVLFEESLARQSVGSYLPGDFVRMDPALRNPLLKLLQERYGYRDGDFERDPRTGNWVPGEGHTKWEEQISRGIVNPRRPRNDQNQQSNSGDSHNRMMMHQDNQEVFDMISSASVPDDWSQDSNMQASVSARLERHYW
ncbi:hypothetical protein VKT23_012743 [Stygiomarasmius scandens]|uniref:Uncharacterized protein n=1 Tax=Marasmiellus scandens TaxID=2682957 RepID=A0ABR1J6B2_9AGAR